MFSSSLCGRALVRPGRVGEYLRLVGRSKPRPYVIFIGERSVVRFSYLLPLTFEVPLSFDNSMFSSSLYGRASCDRVVVGEYLRLVGRSKPRPYVIFSGERRAVRFSYLLPLTSYLLPTYSYPAG